jgi:alpha-tubulin suppressor-like RCC1 family protein
LLLLTKKLLNNENSLYIFGFNKELKVRLIKAIPGELMNIYTKIRSLGASSSTIMGPLRLGWGAFSKSGSVVRPLMKRLLSLSLLALLVVPSVYAQDVPLDSDNDGVSDALEIAAGRNAQGVDYMVSVGDKFSCALDSSGVSCWGDAANGQLDVPALTNPTYVAVGFDHACAIDDTGVVCWGREQLQKTNPPEMSNPTMLELGRLHSCAMDDTGVVCWGSNSSGRSSPPEFFGPTDLSVGSDHACVVDDGNVRCWGKLSNKRGQVPAGLVNPTQVSAGWFHGCALDDSGVSCWGSKAKTGTNTPPALSNPTVVETGTTFSCAIDDTGVVCWGNNGQKQLTRVPVLSNPTQLSLGTDHACAIDATGIVCWGSDGRGKSTVPTLAVVKDNDGDGIEDWEEDVLGTDKYLADTDNDGVNDKEDEMPLEGTESLDTDRDGTGNNADTDDDNDFIPDALEIETGRNPLVAEYTTGVGAKFSCAMNDNGVDCWGDDADGKTVVPTLSNPTQLEVGYEHACAIDDTGVVCWGKDNAGTTNVPALTNPIKVSAGHYHTCALDDTGIVCWGDTSHKLITRMPEFNYPTDVSVGDEHACAIDATGVVCWGKKSNKRGQIPAGLVNPRNLSAGFLHSCVIDDNGVSCWGSRASTGTIEAPELNNPTQVEAGKTFSCALDDSGISCWGANGRKQRVVPNLINPTHFSLGNDHACANDATGVVCWGGNSLGKRDVPGTLAFVLDNDNDGVNDAEDTAPLDPTVGGVSLAVALTVTADDASAVRLTGPWWGWDPNGGPEAVDNGDGTWTVTLDPAPAENMEYLWVVNGVQENLIDNAAGAECSAEIDAGALITDYSGWANRVLVLDSGDASNTYDACAGTPEPFTGLTLTLTTDGSAVRLTGPWWGWDPNGGPEAVDNGDGTWQVQLDPAPTENMEYLWVVDGVQENLIDNAANAECSAEIDAGALITDYSGYANRVHVLDSGDAANDYDACAA